MQAVFFSFIGSRPSHWQAASFSMALAIPLPSEGRGRGGVSRRVRRIINIMYCWVFTPPLGPSPNRGGECRQRPSHLLAHFPLIGRQRSQGRQPFPSLRSLIAPFLSGDCPQRGGKCLRRISAHTCDVTDECRRENSKLVNSKFKISKFKFLIKSFQEKGLRVFQKKYKDFQKKA